MEEIFEKLKKEGKTDLDTLVKWLKDSNVIEDAKSAEDKARALFSDGVNKKSVEIKQFKEALAKLAAEQKKDYDEVSKILAEHGPKLVSALKAGASAFKEAMTKK